MRSRFLSVIATVLVACFSVYLVPGELVHALYGHEDTHHHECESAGGPAIDTRHIHCDFLFYEAEIFTAGETTSCPVSSERTFAYFTVDAEQPAIIFTGIPSLRGPPCS